MCGLVEAGSLETETAQGSTKIVVSPANGTRSCSVILQWQDSQGTQRSC